jgi:hypothetical protein
VIVGQVRDAQWTSVTNACEAIAERVQDELLAGRKRFRLVEYLHYSDGDDTGHFREITFQHRQRLISSRHDAAAEKRGRSTRLRWCGIDIDKVLGCSPQRWASVDYTLFNAVPDHGATLTLITKVMRRNAREYR